MGIINSITNSLKSALGTEQIQAQASSLSKIAGSVLSVPKGPKKSETFEEALSRLHLSEADVERRKIQFLRLGRIYLFLAVVVFLYMFYLLFQKAFFPALGCVGLLMIVLSLFFRCSFWLFQMRERRLGCTFFEWLSEIAGKNR